MRLSQSLRPSALVRTLRCTLCSVLQGPADGHWNCEDTHLDDQQATKQSFKSCSCSSIEHVPKHRLPPRVACISIHASTGMYGVEFAAKEARRTTELGAGIDGSVSSHLSIYSTLNPCVLRKFFKYAIVLFFSAIRVSANLIVSSLSTSLCRNASTSRAFCS